MQFQPKMLPGLGRLGLNVLKPLKRRPMMIGKQGMSLARPRMPLIRPPLLKRMPCGMRPPMRMRSRPIVQKENKRRARTGLSLHLVAFHRGPILRLLHLLDSTVPREPRAEVHVAGRIKMLLSLLDQAAAFHRPVERAYNSVACRSQEMIRSTAREKLISRM